MDELEGLEGISVDGKNMNNIKFADNAISIADIGEKLQALVSKLNDECKSKGLEINEDKKNTTTVNNSKENLSVKIRVGDDEVKQVKRVAHLGRK